MWSFLAQTVGPAPVQGLSPTQAFILAILGMLLPLIPALLRARSNGKVANTVIEGVETFADELHKSPELKAVLAKAYRGEQVTKEDLDTIGARCKTAIHDVAVEEGVEHALAPRVEKVTERLEPSELAKRLLAPPLILLALMLPGCCVSKAELIAQVEARRAFFSAVAPIVSQSAADLHSAEARESRLTTLRTEDTSITILEGKLAK